MKLKLSESQNKEREQKLRRFRYLRNRNLEFFKGLSWESCPVCNKALKTCYYNGIKGMNPHVKYEHIDFLLELLEREEDNKPIDEKGNLCPICNKSWINMKTHVKKEHNLGWNEFVEKYNYSKESLKFTNSHKNKLSNNKKKFYGSSRGKELKNIQSEKVKGNKNPACREEVKLKISLKRQGQPLPRVTREKNSLVTSKRLLENPLSVKSLGYTFQIIYNNKYYYSRSFEEFRVLLSLLENNISFIVEPCRITYVDEDGLIKNYIPDFLIDNIYYETKSSNLEFNSHKYNKCKEKLQSMGSDLRLLRTSTINENLGIQPLTPYQVKNKIKEYFYKGSLFIIDKNTKKSKDRSTLLIELFGENYTSVLAENKDRFYENKKRLCK